MSLSLAKAELIGVFIESLSYGVYLLIFLQCMQVLRRRPSRPSDYLLGTAVSLFVLVTAHLVIDITRNMEAFTTNMDIPNYANDYYSTFDTWKNIVKSALYVTVTVISDAFILYRTFIVWGRNHSVAVIPFLLFLADIGVGILWVHTLSLITPGGNVYTDALSIHVKAFYSITLCLNFMCTCLIAFKIWNIQRAVAPFIKESQDDLSHLVAIIVESGSAYSTVLVLMVATYADNSPVMFIFLNTVAPIIGIVFSSVIVRVGLGLSHGDSHPMRSHKGDHSLWVVRSSARSNASEQLIHPGLGSLPGGAVQIALSHTVHTHVDGFHPAEESETDVGSADMKRESFHMV